MDGYDGPGGWSNIGMNPFAAIQGKLKGALEADKKAAKKKGKADVAVESSSPKQEWNPVRRGRERPVQRGTQGSAETMQRGFMSRVVKAVEPAWGVDSKKSSGAAEPRQFQPRTPTTLRPGQPAQSQYGTPERPQAARRITPGRPRA